MTSGYVVVIEEGADSVGAYCPTLPGVAAVGETRDECLRLVREAIRMHLDALIEDGDPVPEPTRGDVVFVDPAAA